MDNIEDIIECAERLLNEDTPLGLEQLKADIDRDDAADKNRLYQQRESQYGRLKYKCMDSETQLLLFQHLENGTELTVEDIGKELKQAGKEVRKVKSDLQDLRAEREELGYTVNPLYEQYKHLQSEVTALKDELLSMCSNDEEVEELKAEVGVEESRLEELDALQKAIEEESQTPMHYRQMEWYKNYIELIESLSRMKLKFRSNDKFILELVDGSKSESGEPFEVAVSMTGDTLDDLKLSLLSLDAEDICEGTVKQNHLRTAVSRLQSRWQHHLPLLDELNNLRQRFVLDWLPEEGKVTVLYGNDAHMMCILKVEEGYPTTGKVKLLSFSGLPADVDHSTLTPQSTKASLTEWLEHMQSRLSPPNADGDSGRL